MTEPTRLLNHGSNLAKAVLGAAADERPPAELRRKIQAAILVGSAGTAVVAATTASKTSSFLASLSATPVFAKAVGVVVVVGAVASVGARALTRSPVLGAHAASMASPVNAPQVMGPGTSITSGPRPLAREIPPVPEAVAPPLVDPVERVEQGAPTARIPGQLGRSAVPDLAATSSPVAPSSAGSGASDDFAREVVALDSARAALEANDLSATIERLNRHDLDFPHGHLRPEALAIRIEVYAARHDVARVRELAAEFLAQYPGHPFAARVNSMIESAGQ